MYMDHRLSNSLNKLILLRSMLIPGINPVVVQTEYSFSPPDVLFYFALSAGIPSSGNHPYSTCTTARRVTLQQNMEIFFVFFRSTI